MSVIDRLFEEATALVTFDGDDYKKITAIYRNHPAKGIIPFCSVEDWDTTSVAKISKLQSERDEFAAEVKRLEQEIASLKRGASVSVTPLSVVDEAVEAAREIAGEIAEKLGAPAFTKKPLSIEDYEGESTRYIPIQVKHLPKDIKKAARKTSKDLRSANHKVTHGDATVGAVLFCNTILSDGKVCGKGPYTPRGLEGHKTWHKSPNRKHYGKIREYHGKR